MKEKIENNHKVKKMAKKNNNKVGPPIAHMFKNQFKMEMG